MPSEFHDIHVGEPPVLLRKRRGFGVVSLLAGLIFIAGVSGLLWVNYDRLIEASARPGSTQAAAVVDNTPSPSLAEFQSFQQQTTEKWQATGQLVEAQQAEIARLSEQVAALTARIEQLQQPTAAVAPPRAAEPPRVASPVLRPAVGPTAPRKQPAATPPRASGSMSVGGAPLPGAPPPATR